MNAVLNPTVETGYFLLRKTVSVMVTDTTYAIRCC